jgi:hypothetical protein
LLLIGAAGGLTETLADAARVGLCVAIFVDLFTLGAGEFGIPHASELAARAAHEITHGRHRRSFWFGAIGVGHLAPLALLLPDLPYLSALGGLAALVGLYLYEHAFVMAPQELPNS